MGGVNALVEQQGKEDEFEVQRRLLDFKLEQEEALENLRREMPSGGAGFTDAYNKQFRKAARALVGKDDANIPDRLRDKVGLRLKQFETSYLDKASTYERAERDRHTIEKLEGTLGSARASVATNPAAHNDRLQEGNALIEGSALPPEQRRALRQKYSAEVDRAAIESRLGQAKSTAEFDAIKRDVIGGGVKVHTKRVPTAAERKRIRASGGLVINLDSNWAKVSSKNPKGRTPPMIVLPDDATAEEREAAEAYVARVAEVMKEKFGVDLKTRVVTRSENVVNGKARGRLNTAHIEPFAVTDAEAVKFFNSEEGRKVHASILRETLGTIPGAEFSLPHDPGRDPGAVGNGTSEVDLARGLAGHLTDGKVGPYQHLSPADRRRYVSAVNSAHKAIQKALSKEVSELESNAAHGYTLPKEQLTSLAARVNEIGDPVLKTRLLSSLGLAEAISRNAQNPVSVNEQILAELRQRFAQESPTKEQRERLEKMESALATQKSELGDNLLGWSMRSGVVARTRLDPADKASMDARLEAVETSAKTFGVSRQFFTEIERDALVENFTSGKISIVQFAADLTKHWGAKNAAAALKELKAKPSVSLLGGHVASIGMTAVAKDAEAGLKLLKQKDYKPRKIPVEDARNAIKDSIGTTLDHLPETMEAMRGVINAAYEARAVANGWIEFEEKEYAKIARELLGERKKGSHTYGGVVTKYHYFNGPEWGDAVSGNYGIVVPPNVRQDGFFELIEMIKVKDLPEPPRDMFGKPISDDAFQGARMFSLHNGRYLLSFNTIEPTLNPDMVYRNKDGDPYVFNFKDVEPMLKKRRDDLFMQPSP
jgi:hypothetical protein